MWGKTLYQIVESFNSNNSVKDTLFRVCGEAEHLQQQCAVLPVAGGPHRFLPQRATLRALPGLCFVTDALHNSIMDNV
jgi:DNA-binding transcriptional regulator LsrR (DeoR family)